MKPSLRWMTTILGRTEATPTTAAHVFDEVIVPSYTEPRREYHNLSHIVTCLDLYDRLVPIPERSLELELAIWFHDVYYEPTRRDNERLSMLILLGACVRMRIDLRDGWETLLLATEKHEVSNEAADAFRNAASWLCDLDLAVFGAEPSEFDAYERGIRAEYAFVAQPTYVAGRTAVLERFLKRPSIYNMHEMRVSFEDRARANIERSLRALRMSS